MATRLLFVDDESSIRMTLPRILAQEGFEVQVAASVREALHIINQEKFDVLLTDLNIDGVGDGFVLVSAMRRVQPDAVNLILTGFPDFQSALEGIRKQVDDYFTKPADIPALVSTIKEKLQTPRRILHPPTKRVANVLRENKDLIVQRWLAQSKINSRLRSIRIRDDERVDHMPALLEHLASMVEAPDGEVSKTVRSAAARHGRTRATQGYTVSLMVLEAHILNKVLSRVLQENLLTIDLSTLIGDALKIGENLNTLLEESLRSFEHSQRKRSA